MPIKFILNSSTRSSNIIHLEQVQICYNITLMRNGGWESMWKEIEINSWSDFNEAIEGIDLCNWVFRGQSNSKWEIQNSLSREILNFHEGITNEKCMEIELKMMKEFISSLHLFSDLKITETEDDDPKGILNYRLESFSIMQHYGAPTRLVDWTHSPYVATFFGLDGATEDFAVYAINIKELRWNNKIREREGEITQSYDILRKRKKCNGYIVDYQTPRMNERIRRQQGLFLVPSIINKSMSELLKDYGIENGELGGSKVAIKFVFKAKDITKYWNKLKHMNITHETIYPGLDGFCKSLKLNIL